MKGVHYFVSHLGGLRPDKSKKRASRRKKATFGQPLAKVIEHQEKKKVFLKVPVLVEILLDYLINHGIEAEGIFRISGSADEVNSMIRLFSKKKIKSRSDIPADEIYNATSLLKDYIRSVPDELITTSMTQACLQFFESPFLTPIDSSLQILPPHVYFFLGEVFSLLHTVAQYSSINKMTFENLAIVMAPTMCHNPAQDLRSFKELNDKNIKVIRVLIEQAPHLFSVSHNHVMSLRKTPFPIIRLSSSLSALSVHTAAKSGRLSVQSVSPVPATQPLASIPSSSTIEQAQNEPSETSQPIDDTESPAVPIQVHYVEVAPNVIEIKYFPPEEQVYKKLDRTSSTLLGPVHPDGDKSSSGSDSESESHYSDVSEFLETTAAQTPTPVTTPARPLSTSISHPHGVVFHGQVPFRFDPSIHIIRHPTLISQPTSVPQGHARSFVSVSPSPSVLSSSVTSTEPSRTPAGSQRNSLHNLEGVSLAINQQLQYQPQQSQASLHRSAVLNASMTPTDQQQQTQQQSNLPPMYASKGSPAGQSPRTLFPHAVARSSSTASLLENTSTGFSQQAASTPLASPRVTLQNMHQNYSSSPLISSSQISGHPSPLVYQPGIQPGATITYLPVTHQIQPAQSMMSRSVVIQPYQPYQTNSTSYHSPAQAVVYPTQVLYSPYGSSSYHAPPQNYGASLPPPSQQ